jgi:hypothetical protein
MWIAPSYRVSGALDQSTSAMMRFAPSVTSITTKLPSVTERNETAFAG